MNRGFCRVVQSLSVIALFLFSSACTTNSVYVPGFQFDTLLYEDLVDRGRIALFSLGILDRPNPPGRERLLASRSKDFVLSGLDAMGADAFELLRGRSFALLTNATGVDRNLERGLDLMLRNGVRPELVFEPEHGMYGFMDEAGKDGIRTDPETGLRIFSLYSSKRKPDRRVLGNVDLIVVDLQNLPVRCYTYVSTLTDLMDSAERYGIEIMILDRPNPYGFWEPGGGMLDMEFISFVGKAPVPFLYSMTLGEYALYMSSTRFRNLKLSVVQVSGYERDEQEVMAGMSWINPSPNIPTFESAIIYPGMVFFEGTNVSLGRGTTRPFIYSGAPWMDSKKVLGELRKLNLPGVEMTEVVFRPTASLYTDQVNRGIQMIPYSTAFDPIRTGYEYMRIIQKIHPDQFEIKRWRKSYFMDRLWGGDGYRKAIAADLPYEDFEASWADDSKEFRRFIKPFLLY